MDFCMVTVKVLNSYEIFIKNALTGGESGSILKLVSNIGEAQCMYRVFKRGGR